MTAGSNKAGSDLAPGTIGGEGSGSGPGTLPRKPEQAATGQARSKERGKATRSKKQPGKRATQGGS